MSASALRTGLILAAIHSAIVLALLLKVLTLDDGEARWATSLMLVPTIDFWSIPLYAVLRIDLPLLGFYAISFVGGGFVYFVIGYGFDQLWLKLKQDGAA